MPQAFVARYSWTVRTALEPSPTAEATRFIDPRRTSPTAKTPGAEVSNGRGSLSAKMGLSRASAGIDRSVRMKPFSSRATAPCSQDVAGSAPMKQKSATQVLVVRLSRRCVFEDHRFQVAVTAELTDLGIRHDIDVRVGRDAIDEVARHAAREIWSADDDRDPAASLAQVDGSLPGRVAATHHHHVGVTARSRFQIGGRVVDPVAFEPLELGDVQPLVSGTRGDDDRSSGDLALVDERDDVISVLNA